MNLDKLTQLQSQTVNRVYCLTDEMAELVGETDLETVEFNIRRISKAIEVEIEAYEEALREYHGI